MLWREREGLTDAGAVNFKKLPEATTTPLPDIPLRKIVFCLRSDHNARERDRVIIRPAITYLQESRPKESLDQSCFIDPLTINRQTTEITSHPFNDQLPLFENLWYTKFALPQIFFLSCEDNLLFPISIAQNHKVVEIIN